MRLIDADALKELFREVIGGIAKKPEMSGNLEHMVRASAMVIEMIKDAPTIEPEQIVRCKDCKYYQTRQKSVFLPQCCWFDVLTKPNDFCSNGRKENR